jgi:hypothetical protein
LYLRGTFTGETLTSGFTCWIYDPTTRLSTEQPAFGTFADLTSFDARHGHWVAGLAGSPSRVWIDGAEVADPGGWGVSIDGDDVITSGAAPDGPTTWYRGVNTGVHLVQEENGGIVREGVFTAKLQDGRCVMWTRADLAVTDITAVGAGIGYGVPVYCDGFLFQQLEHVGIADQTMLQYYAPGQMPTQVVRPTGSQGWVDVVRNPATGLFVVATLHDGGVAVIDWVTASDSSVVTTTYTDRAPLRHAVMDSRSGLATTPWATWFDQQRKQTSTHPYGWVASQTVLGRSTGSFGPAYPMTVGEGFTLDGAGLSVDLASLIRRGTRLAQPLATAVLIGTLYHVTDENLVERSDGTTWQVFG